MARKMSKNTAMKSRKLLHGDIIEFSKSLSCTDGKTKAYREPPLFRRDLICDYSARLAMWLVRYEGFVDEQATGWTWFQIHG